MYEQVSFADDAPREQAIVVADGAYHPLVHMLDKLGLDTVAGDMENNSHFWNRMPFEEAERFLLWTNGVIRGVIGSERLFSAADVARESDVDPRGYTITCMAPPEEHTRDLLQEFWEASQKGLSAERAASLQALGITLVHGLPYGNGRAARFIYMIRHYGYNGSDEHRQWLNEALENENRRLLDFNPERAELPGKFAAHRMKALCAQYQYEGPLPGGVSVPIEADHPIHGAAFRTQFIVDYFTESHLSVPVITEFLLSKGENPKDFMDDNGELSVRAITEAMGIHEIAQDIDTISRTTKLAFIRSVIDCLGEKGDRSIYGNPKFIVDTYKYGTKLYYG